MGTILVVNKFIKRKIIYHSLLTTALLFLSQRFGFPLVCIDLGIPNWNIYLIYKELFCSTAHV